MPSSPLTILFMPESAYGPTNQCIGIGKVLLERGHRVVFAAEASWQGKLAALGFEEDLVDLAPAADIAPGEPEPDAGQFWKDFIRETAPEFRKPTIEQLETFMKPTWQALIDGSMFCEPQLRAIIRVSAFGPVRMMIPMLSSVDEVHQVLDIVGTIRNEFTRRGIAFDPDMPIGGMIEVPAAAICADVFAKELDFLSIGTNDLIQYAVAIDRVNNEVSYLYDPLNPGVLRLVSTTIGAGRSAGIPVAMCGEMAGDVRYTRLLLGLGLTEFSVHPAALLEIKHIVTHTDVHHAETLAQEFLFDSRLERRRELLQALENGPV